MSWLLVPVHVDALAVEQEGLTSPEREPFVDKKPLEPGVHLHWALPDALGRGTSDPGGASTVRFPAVPDLWLVVRFTDPPPDVLNVLPALQRPPNDRPRPYRAFIVDAYAETVIDLPGAIPPPASSVRDWLTAVGKLPSGVMQKGASVQENRLFDSAYYPTCRKRFGFHDPLSDVDAGPLSYVVIGWYSDPYEDPLHRSGELERPEWVAAQGWDVGSEEPAGGVLHTPLAPKSITAALSSVHMASTQLGPRASTIDGTFRTSPVTQEGILSGLSSVKVGAEDVRAIRDKTQRQIKKVWKQIDERRKRAGMPGSSKRKIGSSDDPGIGPVQLGTEFPGRIACHGAVVDVAWAGRGGTHRGQAEVSGGSPEFYLADSLSQAAADGFSRGRKTTGGIVEEMFGPTMDLFNALIDGLLNDLETPSAKMDLPNRLHAAGFIGHPGESSKEWELALLPPGTGGSLKAAQGQIAAEPHRVNVHDRRVRKPGAADDVPPVHRTLPGAGFDLGIKDTEAGAQLGSRQVAGPRFYRPLDPVLLFCGFGKTWRYGHDGRLDPDGQGRLVCRTSSQVLRALGVDFADLPQAPKATVGPRDLIGSGPDLSKLPPVVWSLVAESALLDPVNARAMARTWLVRTRTPSWPQHLDRASHAFEIETELWWGLADPKADRQAILDACRYVGTLPSPIAVTPWRQPFAPLFSEAVYSFKGDDKLAPGVQLDGVCERSLLTDSLSIKFNTQSLSSAGLLTISRKSLDVLSATLPALDDKLRAAGKPLRSGTVSLAQLRLVDVFGQVRWLVKDGKVLADITSQGATKFLPPRLPYFSRLQFRFMSAADGTQEAEPGRSPICGYLVPDYIEHGLEVFDARGNGLGQLRHQLRGGKQCVIWESHPWAPRQLAGASDTPDTSDTPGAPGQVIANPYLLQMVRSLLSPAYAVDAKGETALAAMLRALDTTQLAQDRQGRSTEHRPLLGRPVAVVRGRMRLETTPTDREPLDVPQSAARPMPQGLRVQVGSLTQLDDGLLGFFVDDNYQELRPVDPIVRTQAIENGPGRGFQGDPQKPSFSPITSPYIAADSSVALTPNQDVQLLMLMEPRSQVYLISQVLPRKRAVMQPEFFEEGLGRLSPSFSVGPVLFDPDRLTLPVAEIAGWRWLWRHKEAGEYTEAELDPLTTDSGLGERPALLEEGWLGLRRS